MEMIIYVEVTRAARVLLIHGRDVTRPVGVIKLRSTCLDQFPRYVGQIRTDVPVSVETSWPRNEIFPEIVILNFYPHNSHIQ